MLPSLPRASSVVGRTTRPARSRGARWSAICVRLHGRRLEDDREELLGMRHPDDVGRPSDLHGAAQAGTLGHEPMDGHGDVAIELIEQ